MYLWICSAEEHSKHHDGRNISDKLRFCTSCATFLFSPYFDPFHDHWDPAFWLHKYKT